MGSLSRNGVTIDSSLPDRFDCLIARRRYLNCSGAFRDLIRDALVERSILSTLHVHLDHDHCLEVVGVRGKAAEARKIADSQISAKGVQHGRLTITTSGADLG